MGDIKISAHCTLFIWGAAAGERKKSELYTPRAAAVKRDIAESWSCNLRVLFRRAAGMSSMGKKIGGAQVHLLYYARRGLFCVHLLPRAILLLSLRP